MVWWLQWVEARALDPMEAPGQGKRKARRRREAFGLPRMVEVARGRVPVAMLMEDPQLGRFDWRVVASFALLGVVEGAVAWWLKSWGVLWLVVGAPLTMGLVGGMACAAVTGFMGRAAEAGKLRALMATELWPGDVDSGLLVIPAAWVVAGLVAMEAGFLPGVIGGALRGGQPFFAMLGVMFWMSLRLGGMWLAARCGLYIGWRRSVEAMRRSTAMPVGWQPWADFVRERLKPVAAAAIAICPASVVVLAAPCLTAPVGIVGMLLGVTAGGLLGLLDDEANRATEVLMAEGCSIADVPDKLAEDDTDDDDLGFDDDEEAGK